MCDIGLYFIVASILMCVSIAKAIIMAMTNGNVAGAMTIM